MEILAKLFGDEARLVVLRLFLFNPETAYGMGDIARRSGVRKDRARGIVRLFLSLGVIRAKRMAKKETGYALNHAFPYAPLLTDLIAAASLQADRRLAARIAPAGKVKLVIAGGIFTRQMGARLDLLVVGDLVREAKLDRIIGSLEGDIGREISYSSLTTAEFDYRLAMHDRLVRDILDFPYIVVTDRIGFSRKNAGK